MTTEEVLFRVAMYVIPAVFSVLIVGFWSFYKMSLKQAAMKVENLATQYEYLQDELRGLQIEVTTLKERSITYPQVESIIDKRLEHLQKEMILRFDAIEKLIKQMK